MQANWKVGVGLLAIVIAVALGLALSPPREAFGQGRPAGGGGRYTVVGTDGTHLVVTDNQENKVFFYAIDKDGKPGDPLKFRGTIDLNDVGKDTIQPTKPR
jgi:hypothetical protein